MSYIMHKIQNNMSLSKVHHSLVSDLFTTLTFLTNQSYILKLNIIKTDKSSKRLPLFCIPQSFPLIILILMTLPTVKCQHTHTHTISVPCSTQWDTLSWNFKPCCSLSALPFLAESSEIFTLCRTTLRIDHLPGRQTAVSEL